MSLSDVSFKANFVKPVNIQRYEKSGYKPMQASFVKCDIFNAEDLKSLEDVAKQWGAFSYAENIYSLLSGIKDVCKYHKSYSSHLYMLTLLQDSYEKIDDKNILGCVLLGEQPKKIEINYLQVNPKYMARRRPRAKNSFFKFIEKYLLFKKETEYKGIGRGILDSIKELYYDKNFIELISDPSAMKFYKENGFKSQFCLNYMRWHRKT